MSTQSTIGDWGTRQTTEQADESPLHERVLEDVDGARYSRDWSGMHNGDTDRPPRTRCQGCGSHVDPDYHRVNEDPDGVLHACQSCATMAELQRGAGAGIAHEAGDRL